MSVRTNILLRKFGKCTFDVLLRTYCLCLYDIALWHSYSRNGLNKFPSYYNRCIKIFLGYKRRDSLTSVLLDARLPSFNTALHICTLFLLYIFLFIVLCVFLYFIITAALCVLINGWMDNSSAIFC